MRPYALIDLHCDTLTACERPTLRRDTLDLPTADIALSRLPKDVRWAQCFALFLPDKLPTALEIPYYNYHLKNFRRQMAKFAPLVSHCRSVADMETAWAEGKTAAFLTVENGSALHGRPERVEVLARDGVKMMTITWNGENQLASGWDTNHGLSPLGREVLPRMERAGILVDLSHMNDTGFFQAVDLLQKPFVASHSNARAVCSHRRNLTDDQIRVMVERKCLIGMNYCKFFLRDGGDTQPEDLRRHAEHFLELGAEDCLALGSDFDGTTLPHWLSSTEDAVSLYDRFRSWGFSAELCDKILYRNALDFFRANLG